MKNTEWMNSALMRSSFGMEFGLENKDKKNEKGDDEQSNEWVQPKMNIIEVGKLEWLYEVIFVLLSMF